MNERGNPVDVEPIVLRPLYLSDAADVLSAFRSNGDMLRQGNVRTLDEAREYISNLINSENPYETWVVSQTNGELKGLVGISVDEENRNGWLWYWMHDAARRRGWMKRAVISVANWALTERGLQRLELGHRVNNPASGMVAKAAGFVREGIEREKFLVDGCRIDVATYGRLCSDPWPEIDPFTVFSS